MPVFKRSCVILLVMVAAACNKATTPTAPTTPPVAACQSNNTATVSFENKSNTNSTYTIVWDGSTRTTIAPGQTSSTYTEAAGVQHSLQFKFTNSNNPACTTSSPTLAQCSVHVYNCTG